MALGVSIYEIDGLYYYVAESQNKIIQRKPRTQWRQAVKNSAYATARKGEPVRSPEGFRKGMVFQEPIVLTEKAPEEVAQPPKVLTGSLSSKLREDTTKGLDLK